MWWLVNIFLTVLFIIEANCYRKKIEVDKFDLLMPNVYPSRDELYLCTPIRINPNKNYYIVGFEPNATMHTAHHMLLYGCTEPGRNDAVWDCGEMAAGPKDPSYKSGKPCQSGSQIVYAWARDAPSLTLPEDVGFLVGQDSEIKYLVLQVHYMSKFPAGKLDNSGVFLKYTKTQMPRQAGVFLLGTGGAVPAHSTEHMEVACTVFEDKVIHPFAFRTHTHRLGKVVSGYVVTGTGSDAKWRLLGKKNPQLPQMFYSIEDQTPIVAGDVLAARCTMQNDNDHQVSIGATNEDEMCNFYLMYWTETAPLSQKYCFSPGPPYYYWSRASQGLGNIPNIEASRV
ncbi:unnamed protein product [Plutella xylostella]|uniref:peptidylglycine monooxygenase n=1 Tax=Plutella xylostella TaxID=51655 RepID=A0A8S4EQJ6_PLUXY|nr:unnamed protein product [Plutella xylostella]